MTSTTFRDGDWTYRKATWYGTWIATNDVTGERHDTGADHIRDAYAFIDQLAKAKAPAPTATYTIASGPQRARAGHQRRRAYEF
jgi:hypothetical protein